MEKNHIGTDASMSVHIDHIEKEDMLELMIREDILILNLGNH